MLPVSGPGGADRAEEVLDAFSTPLCQRRMDERCVSLWGLWLFHAQRVPSSVLPSSEQFALKTPLKPPLRNQVESSILPSFGTSFQKASVLLIAVFIDLRAPSWPAPSAPLQAELTC